jgi:hypothetical protein
LIANIPFPMPCTSLLLCRLFRHMCAVVLTFFISQAFLWWTNGASAAARAIGFAHHLPRRLQLLPIHCRQLDRGGTHAFRPSCTRCVCNITSRPHLKIPGLVVRSGGRHQLSTGAKTCLNTRLGISIGIGRLRTTAVPWQLDLLPSASCSVT